jgi:hypothetical protein
VSGFKAQISSAETFNSYSPGTYLSTALSTVSTFKFAILPSKSIVAGTSFNVAKRLLATCSSDKTPELLRVLKTKTETLLRLVHVLEGQTSSSREEFASGLKTT